MRRGKFFSFAIIGFLILSILIFQSNGSIDNTKVIKESIFNFDTFSAIKPNQVGNETIIETPKWNPAQPGPNDPVIVTSIINDLNGVDNATLFWDYGNETLHNTTMGVTSTPIGQNSANFETTGYIDNTGSATTQVTSRKFLNFKYEEQLINGFNIDIPERDRFIYIRIDIKNVTTNLWETFFEAGSTVGTTGMGNQQKISSLLIAGIDVFAINYRQNQNGRDFNNYSFTLFEKEYDGTITAPNNPVFTTFYISVYDLNGTLTVSPSNTFLVDNAPQIQILNLPISTKSNIILNVTVSDIDGVGTINDSSVIVYYKLASQTSWQSKQLTFVKDLGPPFDFAIYDTSVPITTLGEVETDLEIVVNASDIVQGKTGYSSSSGLKKVKLDTLGPRLDTIVYKANTFFENVTSLNTSAEITATFSDASGIQNVSIFYSNVSSSNFNEMKMQNTTNIALGIKSSSFKAILPGFSETGEVTYFFVLIDFLNNKINTSNNLYFVDGEGPEIGKNELLIHPALVILNTTDARVLFNATDMTDIKDKVVWYSYDNGTIWNSVGATIINYNNIKFPPEKYDAKDQLPFALKNKGTSFLSLPISRKSNFQTATMYLGITHERSSDLRIWIKLDNGKRFLIFDRNVNTDLSNLQFDLLDLGFVYDEFNKNNFTLEIQDISSLYTGFVIDFRIELINYEIPLGYQFEATIPKANNDTKVIFFVTLTDFLNNVANSTMFSYHSDGTPPELDVDIQSSPIDLKGSSSILITATATDAGGIDDVEIYYRFGNTNDWNIKSMTFDSTLGKYKYNLSMPTESGKFTYWIRAFDKVGLANNSDQYTVVFEGATAVTDTEVSKTDVSKTDDKGDGGISTSTMILLASILGAVGGIGALVYLFRSGKLKIPSRFKKKTI